MKRVGLFLDNIRSARVLRLPLQGLPRQAMRQERHRSRQSQRSESFRSRSSRRSVFPWPWSRCRASGFGLFHTTIKPGERHSGAAARAVVLDEEPWADALHPHSATIVVLVGEREGVALRCGVALEVAVMEIARGGNE